MSDEQIVFFLIASTASILFISFGLIFFIVVFFQSKKKTFIKEQKKKIAFANEMVEVKNEVQNQTLTYIAQELHDNIGQMLVIANLKVIDLKKNINQAGVEDLELLLKNIALQTRTVSKSLNTEFIHEFGLVESIKMEIQRLQKLKLVNVDFDNEIESLLLSKEKQLVVFRILQEFISNTLKYAQASSLSIKLNHNNNYFEMTISDNGIGFNLVEIKKLNGSGFVNIKSRARLLNADVQITSSQMQGTVLVLKCPINN